MNKITLANTPPRGQDYELNGKFARVIYVPKETNSDRVTVNMQAFEIDANGAFVSGPNGAPSRTHATDHTITTSNLGDTHTLKPAWVREQRDANPTLAAEQNVDIVTQLPATAEIGDRVYKDPYFYMWVQGMIADNTDAKAAELFKLLANSAQLHAIQL